MKTQRRLVTLLKILAVGLIIPIGMGMELLSEEPALERATLKGFDRPIAAHAAGMLERSRIRR